LSIYSLDLQDEDLRFWKKKEDENGFVQQPMMGSLGYVLWGTMLVWLLLSLVSLFVSLRCFVVNPKDTTNNVIGLVLAALFGPFYFIFYGLKSTYCKKPSGLSLW